MSILEAKIPAIHCGGCATSIEKALKGSGKVRSTKVDVDARTARIDGDITEAELLKILDGIGFDVVSVQTV